MEQENSISRKYQILLMINQAVFHRFRGERERNNSLCVPLHVLSALTVASLLHCCLCVADKVHVQPRIGGSVRLSLRLLAFQGTTSDTHLSPGRLGSSQNLPHEPPYLTSRVHIFRTVSPVLEREDNLRYRIWLERFQGYIFAFDVWEC